MPIRTHIFALSLACSTAAALAGGVPINFQYYTGFDDPGVDPGVTFSVSVDAEESQGWVDFTFSLDVVQGLGTITQIWFENGAAGLGDATIADSTGTVDMRVGNGTANPAGADGVLGWIGTHERVGRHGSVFNGIDAGESLTVRFDADSSFFWAGLDAILSGEVRIAFHLQRIGPDGEESAHYYSSTGTGEYTTPIPLPGAGLMAAAVLAAGGGLSRPRRR